MNLNSRIIYEGRDRAPARAYQKGLGFTDEDLRKPIIGIANTWIGTMPCNWLLRDLAVDVARGIREAGGTPMEFNTIAISDGITMGTQAMKTSLISREVVADSIELVTRGNCFDGLVCLVACDKTIPGSAMALLRLNIPGVVLYGGSILPGRYKGKDITIQEVFEAVFGEVPVYVTMKVIQAPTVEQGILQEVTRCNCELVVMGSAVAYSLQTDLFGVLTDRIAEHMPCSVLLVRRFEPSVLSWLRRRLHHVVPD